jgi:hypothetical protein
VESTDARFIVVVVVVVVVVAATGVAVARIGGMVVALTLPDG